MLHDEIIVGSCDYYSGCTVMALVPTHSGVGDVPIVMEMAYVPANASGGIMASSVQW